MPPDCTTSHHNCHPSSLPPPLPQLLPTSSPLLPKSLTSPSTKLPPFSSLLLATILSQSALSSDHYSLPIHYHSSPLTITTSQSPPSPSLSFITISLLPLYTHPFSHVMIPSPSPFFQSTPSRSHHHPSYFTIHPSSLNTITHPSPFLIPHHHSSFLPAPSRPSILPHYYPSPLPCH